MSTIKIGKIPIPDTYLNEKITGIFIQIQRITSKFKDSEMS